MTNTSAIRQWKHLFIAFALAFALAATNLANSMPGSGTHPLARVIVINGDHSHAAVSAVRSLGGFVLADLHLIGGFAAAVPPEALKRLATITGVAAVLPDRSFRATGGGAGGGAKGAAPTTPLASAYTKAVDAPTAWNAGYRGKLGVNVAVLDSGIAPVDDLTKPTNRIAGWVDFVDGSTTPRDPYGHGTFVAGAIAGNGTLSSGKWKGIAPEAGLVGIRVLDATGTGTASRIIQGIQWAVDNAAAYSIRVINMSFSTNSDLTYRLDAVTYAAEKAWKAGIVVVASAGNLGPLPGTVLSPGIDPYVITVGATDDRGTAGRTDDTMASFSGAGPTRLDLISKPDIVAPGVWNTGLRVIGSTIDITHPLSVRDTYYFDGSGTSPAAGVVSGVVALMLQKRPTLVPDQVKYVLKATTTAAPSSNVNIAGAGYVNAYNATVSKLTAKANFGLIPATGGGLLALVGIPDVKMR